MLNNNQKYPELFRSVSFGAETIQFEKLYGVDTEKAKIFMDLIWKQILKVNQQNQKDIRIKLGTQNHFMGYLILEKGYLYFQKEKSSEEVCTKLTVLSLVKVSLFENLKDEVMKRENQLTTLKLFKEAEFLQDLYEIRKKDEFGLKK